MEENTRTRQAPQDRPPDQPLQVDTPGDEAEEPEPEGGESACWAHLLDEDGRLP